MKTQELSAFISVYRRPIMIFSQRLTVAALIGVHAAPLLCPARDLQCGENGALNRGEVTWPQTGSMESDRHFPYNTGESLPSNARRTILTGGYPCRREASWEPWKGYLTPWMFL